MTRESAVIVVCCVLASCLGGCNSPGGMGYSADRFVYQSNEWQPWTVSLVDTRTGESLWSVDVPVGQQLVVGFREGSGPNEFKPDMMYWGLTEYGRGVSRTQNQIPAPGPLSRRLEPVLRPTPELPGTPLPGSALASRVPAEKTLAARAGKIPEGTADLFAPAKKKMPSMPTEPAETMEESEPSAPPATESMPPVNEPTTPEPASDEPPIDLPQGTRGPG